MKKKIDTKSKKKPVTKSEKQKLFPVAAIGASAGGIEAIGILLENLSVNNGMAYVIIQHLSATHKSMLPEIFAKKTSMPVHSVKNGMKLHRDNIYVIPPDTLMGIVDGHLTLSPRKNAPVFYHPIDHFMIHLAEIYQNKAIGIILSGTATDGTAGLRSIKAEGGITFAQDSSAKFDGMPKTALQSGQVDFLLSPADIAKEITAICQLPYISVNKSEDLKQSENEIKKILTQIFNKWKVDFSVYKQSTIQRRIMRRVALNRLGRIDDYTILVSSNEAELNILYNDLLINVTSFFRDAEVFRVLSKKIFPDVLRGREPSDPVRIWVAACSTGEEAYSIAIALFEYLADKSITQSFQIFATDLNDIPIEKARTGVYPKSALQHISAQQLKKYFIPLDGHYQVIKAIRDVCIFARHNLLTDPPFSKIDIVSCQNLLIYLEPSSQKTILQSFYYSVKSTGYLILGKSESVLGSSDLFEQIHKDQKIFIKLEGRVNFSFHFPVKNQVVSENENHKEKKVVQQSVSDLEKETDKILLSKYIPPSIVVNKDLNILRFYGHTADYLQPASGKASLNLLKMVKDELLFELRRLVQLAKKEEKAVKKEKIHFKNNNSITEIDLEIVPLRVGSREPCYLILFKESRRIPLKQKTKSGDKNQIYNDEKDIRISGLEEELRDAREQVKNMSEEFEHTREELQTSSEEVLSSNEELQSINEELETSKEELQSSNEELVTINEELNIRNKELKEAFEYRQAIVETIKDPLVVLSGDFRILTVNKAFNRLFKTISPDISGIYLDDFGNGQWNVPLFRKKLKEVISKNKSFSDFIVTVYINEIGDRILSCSAVQMESADTRESKILLLIEDISEKRKAQEDLKKSNDQNLTILNSISDVFITIDNNWKCTFANKHAEQFTGKKQADIINKNLWDILPDYSNSLFYDNIEHTMKTKTFAEFDFFDSRSQQWFHHRLYPSKEIISIYSNNITEQKLSAELAQQSRERYRTFISKSTEGIWRFEITKTIAINLPEKKQIKLLLDNAILAECNDSIAGMYNYKNAEEIINMPLGDLLEKENSNHFLSQFIKNNYRLTDTETKEKNSNGEEKYYLHNVVGIIDNNEIKRIWGTQRDITELKLGLNLLMETQKKLSLALSAGSVALWLWDIETGLIEWTKEQQQLYGLENDFVSSNYEDWLALINPDDVIKLESIIKNSIIEKQYINTEFRINLPDKSIRWILFKATVNYDNDGNAKQVSGLNIDITDQKMIEKQKEDFIGIASHELKTPVTSLKLYAEILHEILTEKDDLKSAELVKKMGAQVDRLTRLIKELLDVTRMSSGQMTFKMDYFDIEKLINDVAEEMQGISPKHKIIIHKNASQRAYGDANKIAEVITNLVTNAIKYSPQADKVIINVNENESGIIISVKDFGIGLNENLQQKIFERFFRVNDPVVNTFPGLGLGLYICSEIIKKHSGKIWVESKKNNGSEFFFSLPVKH